MVPDASGQHRRPENMVAVLTRRGDVIWSRGPRRATFLTPCVIDSKGVRLYRWLLRSEFIPLDRVDRFDVVLREYGDTDFDFGDRGDLLVLLTRDGKRFGVVGVGGLGPWHRGLSPESRAQQLNNSLPRSG